MKVALVAPSINKSLTPLLPDGIPINLSRNYGIYPHLGICYIAGVLKQNGFPVHIIDADGQNLSKRKILKKIKELKPDIVGISAMTFTFLQAIEIAKEIKSMASVPIVLGGVHPTLYPKETLTHTFIDMVVVGEGEFTFLDLVNAMKDGAPATIMPRLKKIKGLAFRERDEIIVNPSRDLIKDLDSLPFLPYELLKDKYYYGLNLPTPYVTMMTSRGCPYSCYFCCKTPWGGTVRFHSAKRVAEEIEVLIKEHDIKGMTFMDDTLTLSPQRTMEIIEHLKKKRLSFNFCCFSRVDTINKKMLLGLKEIGCKVIYFGVESASPRILKKLNKETTIEQMEQSLKWSSDAGIWYVAGFTVGNPEETYDDIVQTIKFIKRNRIPFVKANVLIPYPGSAMYREMLENRSLEEDYWKNFTLKGDIQGPSPVSNKIFTRKELARIRNRINRIPYLRLRSNFLNINKIRLRTDIIRTFINFKEALFNKNI